jgi:regulator of cell morphogenesis and NO signaling
MNLRSTAVGELAAKMPGLIELFEELGLDYSCRGRRSLADACDAAGLSVESVLLRIDEQVDAAAAGEQWHDRTARELIHHLVTEHHAATRTSLSHLQRDIARLRKSDAEACPNLGQIELIALRLGELLSRHMSSEESEMFPYIVRLENSLRSGSDAPAASDSLANRVLVEYIEHDQVAERFSKLRELTGSYVIPEGATRAHANLIRDLRRYDRAVHRHMHLENNILLPRAVELENQLKHGGMRNAKRETRNDASSP